MSNGSEVRSQESELIGSRGVTNNQQTFGELRGKPATHKPLTTLRQAVIER